MSAMHTPGPYTACFTLSVRLREQEVVGFAIVAQPWGSTHPIATYYYVGAAPERSSAEIEATGRLFAAAPDLLSACREAREALAEVENEDSVRHLLDTAIAKAEGRT